MARMMQRRMVMQIPVLLAVALALGVGTLGSPPSAAAESATISAHLNADGSGSLIVNPTSQGWSWEACVPDLSKCTQFATGQIITTVGAEANTVFRASAGGTTALSPVWHGNVTSLTPPSVSGVVRANELVTPIPGQWGGGWEGDLSFTQLSACASPEGIDCTTLTDRTYSEEHPEACPNGSAVLDPAFTGEYLRVADLQVGPRPVSAGVGTSSPYRHEVWAANPLTAVAIVGRIAPAVGPRTAKCGPPALVKASISKKGVATVRCGLGCRVVLIAKRGRHSARLARNLRPFPFMAPRNYPIPKLSLSPQSLMRLGSGRARMIVMVDGRRATRRTVLLG